MSADRPIPGLELSRRVFRLFLIFFPARFRKDFENDMLELFGGPVPRRVPVRRLERRHLLLCSIDR